MQAQQIITSNHKHLHDMHVFTIYNRIYQTKTQHILPPVPVIHKDKVKPYFSEKTKKAFEAFEKNHLKAEFFLLDGSHRTTAAAINNADIAAQIITNNAGVKQLYQDYLKGKQFQFLLPKTFEQNIQEIARQFNENPYFHTAEEKAHSVRTFLNKNTKN